MSASAGNRGTGRKACVVLGTIAAVVLLSVSAVNAQGSFTDKRDGKKYRTVKIGKQTWMAENLNYKTVESVCYDNEESNCQEYGRLYDWDDAMKACPAGWHLPSDDEWWVLTDFVGGKKTAGTKLKSKTGWFADKYMDKGYKAATDDYGFSALPGGVGYSDGSFDIAGSNGGWWSATASDANYAWGRYMDYNLEGVGRNGLDKSFLFSLRCSQDFAVPR
ncbi:MAG: fibrobacter succinogenes major paralogous domain-containing protein [Chitinispirillia bacterium]|nr:fibrobacter succinogenes major paralogous domain-containing protein [Chitinispirillia bacterium]MCL2242545.1 fibrobacter succinogenes major paralogous domain-containing protein [Chitinispirillia bacterium]